MGAHVARSRSWLSRSASSHVMFQIRTNVNAECVRDGLCRLIESADCEAGYVEADRFRLVPKTGRRGVRVAFYGRIIPESDGTLVSAWALPHWTVVFSALIWCGVGIPLAHAPLWLIAFGLVALTVGFIVEARRGYDLLREIGMP